MRSGRRKASGSVVAEEGLKALVAMVRRGLETFAVLPGRERNRGHKAVRLVRATAK